MPADDLVRRIALDSLCARVPARNVPIAVQHVDGVVGDALHEQAKLLLTFTQSGLGFTTLGEVSRDLDETDQPACAVPDRINDDISPEFRTVLSDVPTLIFELTLAFGHIQRTTGQARLAVLFGVKSREMLADDFGFVITLKQPGPRIPACDDALRIEHIDGVIGDRIDQHAVTALADFRGLKPLRILHSIPRRSRYCVLTGINVRPWPKFPAGIAVEIAVATMQALSIPPARPRCRCP